MDGDFRIGEWLVSPALNQISRNGNSTRVEPKAMQVLVYLGEHTGVVRKEELISAVWPNLFVSDDVLPGCISALRKAFNDNARRPRIIETIHKSGYRLLLPIEPINGNGPARVGQEVVPISWWRRAISHRAALAIGVLTVVAVLVAAFTRAPSRTRYDSAAVLPFVNGAGDAETEYLSEGIAEEVVNDLSQLRNVRVMV